MRRKDWGWGLSLGLLVMGAACGFWGQGCRTASRSVISTDTNGVAVTNVVPVEELDPAAAPAISGVAAVGAAFAVQKDPHAGPYLALVSAAFRSAAAAGDYRPASLQGALGAISVRELRDPVAEQLVGTLFLAYKGSYARYVDSQLEQAEWGPLVKGILVAVAEGLDAGVVK